MASAVDWPGANKTMMPPAGHEGHVSALRAFGTDQVCVSCWELTDKEFYALAQGGKLFVSVFGMAGSMPPIFVGGEAETRRLLADYGPVWPKSVKIGGTDASD